MKRPYVWLFFLVWLYCYIAYPAWYVPESAKVRLILFAALLFFFLLNAHLLYRWLDDGTAPLFSEINKSRILAKIKENLPLVYLLCLYILLQIYPMCLPLKTLGDEHYHAYVPIPILRLISQHPPLPVPLLTWGLIILGFLSIRFGRRKVKINLRGSLLLGIVVVLAFVYCLVLIRSGLV